MLLFSHCENIKYYLHSVKHVPRLRSSPNKHLYSHLPIIIQYFIQVFQTDTPNADTLITDTNLK